MQPCGVAAPVTGNAAVAQHRNAGREGLQRGQAAGVLDEYINRTDQLRHLLDPTEAMLDPVGLQLPPQHPFRPHTTTGTASPVPVTSRTASPISPTPQDPPTNN